jgi:hypothetical protein
LYGNRFAAASLNSGCYRFRAFEVQIGYDDFRAFFRVQLGNGFAHT